MTSLQTLLRHAVMTFVGCLSIASASYAQQQPDVVVSDSLHNTAMGTYALLSVTPSQISGYANTAAGDSALTLNTTGHENTALGANALQFNVSGSANTASGVFALSNNTGSNNTAFGAYALVSNTTGNNNTASGYFALGNNNINSNNTGNNNTASGAYALQVNMTGGYNTASGFEALYSNTNGSFNTASGVNALYNSNGQSNTAVGFAALYNNKTGNVNTAVGDAALYHNTTGFENTALGYAALAFTTGQRNSALGHSAAGYFVTTGSNNIEIGNPGSARDNGVIRIGELGIHTATYLAGVSSTHVIGAAVYVTTAGQLGVLASSERYKTAVAPMGSSTKKLTQLRPVTFHLKNDPAAEVQYGLIAEEVARVYPELVIRDENGVVQGVRYEELAPMLLNEVQQQQRTIAGQERKLAELQRQVAALERVVAPRGQSAAGGQQ